MESVLCLLSFPRDGIREVFYFMVRSYEIATHPAGARDDGTSNSAVMDKLHSIVRSVFAMPGRDG
jgi:hypothetical protein